LTIFLIDITKSTLLSMFAFIKYSLPVRNHSISHQVTFFPPMLRLIFVAKSNLTRRRPLCRLAARNRRSCSLRFHYDIYFNDAVCIQIPTHWSINAAHTARVSTQYLPLMSYCHFPSAVSSMRLLVLTDRFVSFRLKNRAHREARGECRTWRNFGAARSPPVFLPYIAFEWRSFHLGTSSTALRLRVLPRFYY